jgi:hypothetical protein
VGLCFRPSLFVVLARDEARSVVRLVGCVPSQVPGIAAGFCVLSGGDLLVFVLGAIVRDPLVQRAVSQRIARLLRNKFAVRLQALCTYLCDENRVFPKMQSSKASLLFSQVWCLDKLGEWRVLR